MEVRRPTIAETIEDELRVASAVLRSRGGDIGVEIADHIDVTLVECRDGIADLIEKGEARRKATGEPYDPKKHLWPGLAAHVLMLDHLREGVRKVIEGSPPLAALGITLSRNLYRGSTEIAT